MGVASYNRGTKVIREQISREAAEIAPAVYARHERETAKETIESLRQQLAASIAENAATTERFTSELDDTKNELANSKQTAAHYKERMKTAQKALAETTHNRNKLSAIARTFRRMHPEQYADIRQHAEELYPNTFRPFDE
jgi:chromosome segregation ATPase